jgi:GT2 family glycosyltransferase
VDWCWRIQRAGWSVFCVPAARVVHHSGVSTRQSRSRSYLDLWRSRHRLYDRFYNPVRRWAAGRIVQLGMRGEVHRARVLAARGAISPEDLDRQVEAARQVRELFGGKSGTRDAPQRAQNQ